MDSRVHAFGTSSPASNHYNTPWRNSELRIGSNDHPSPPYFRRSSGGGVVGSSSGGSNEYVNNRGSMRKVLPPTPDMDTQMSLSAKMIDRRTSTPKGNHSYGPFFLEYSLLAEYNLVRKQKLPGVYVIPSTHSPLQWYGVIFLRSGIYQEGIFRFKIIIPENYPDGDCPRVYFDHSVFHPLVSPEAPFEMDIKRGPLKKWRRNVNHIWQILHLVRRNFYRVETNNPLNHEAARLYDAAFENGGSSQSLTTADGPNYSLELTGSQSLAYPASAASRSEGEFAILVRDCVSEWRDRLYECPATDDPHFLTFHQYEPKVHEPVRIAMVEDARRQQEAEDDQVKSRNCQSLNINGHHQVGGGSMSPFSGQGQFSLGGGGMVRGHTFLQPGSLEIFSRTTGSHSESSRRLAVDRGAPQPTNFRLNMI